MRACYADADHRWRSVLSWDARETWDTLERARRIGALAGAVVADDDAGDVRAWTYSLRHGAELQIGGIDARTDADTAEAFDAALGSTEAATADSITLFAMADAPGLRDHLLARGFIVD